MGTPGQFVRDAMFSGYQQRSAQRDADKQQLRNLDMESQWNGFQNTISNLQAKLPSLLKKDANGNPVQTPEYQQTISALEQAIRARNDFLHPAKNPGALQKFAHLLKPKKGGESPASTVQPQSATVPQPGAGPVTLSAESAYKQATAAPTPGSVPASPAPGPSASTAPKPAPASGAMNKRPNPEDQPRDVSFAFNKQFAKPGPYVTTLTPDLERQFQFWAHQHPDLVQGELNTSTPDYDVRGRWLAERRGDPRAKLVRSEFDGKLHANDRWKTPYDATFSNESMYALPNAPHWQGSQLVTADGKVLVDETPQGAGSVAPAAGSPKPAQGSVAPTATQPGVAGATLEGLGGGEGTAVPLGKSPKVVGPTGTPKELKQKAQAYTRAQQEANLLAAAAPVSPEEQAVAQAHAQTAGTLTSLKDTLDAVDQFFPPDEREKARQNVRDKAFGGTAATTGKWIRVPGKMNNQPTTLLYNEKTGEYRTQTGESVDSDLLKSFQQDAKSAPKPSTSKFGVNVESYKAMHGIPPEQPLTPQELNFVEQQIALSSAAPSESVTNTLKQNFEGFWVPIQETNRRIPGFGYILNDPRGAASRPPAAPGAATPTAATGGGGAAQPRAAARPPAAPRAAGGTAPRGGGSVRVGAPLFAAPNKDYTDLKSQYESAERRVKTMENNLKDALRNGDQQAMLSLVANHIGMTLGAQKGARINQAVWNEAVRSAPWIEASAAQWFHYSPSLTDPSKNDLVFDGFKSGVTLTPDQMRSMVNLAHEQRDILKTDVSRKYQELSHPQGGDPTAPAAAPVGGVQTFTDAGKTYHIPAALVDEFKKDHPNAR